MAMFTDFGTELGSGQYGVVFKGILKPKPGAQVREYENVIPVAVKTVRPNVEIEYFKALLSELKILSYVGSHENVARLLGAYTANIRNRELYVAVEFCKCSLLKHLRDIQDGVSGGDRFVNRKGHAEETGQETCFQENTSELIRWAAEIAAGMDYLARKRIVHGDLAARNILLSFDLKAKVADFGLARQLKDYTYIKSQRCQLPWKWMAVESLAQMSFSTKSDVWAYGVTVWETFSLGQVPYPCTAWNWDFVEQLRGGLRLPQPAWASDEV